MKLTRLHGTRIARLISRADARATFHKLAKRLERPPLLW
jgi:hypothetical protein